MSTSARLLLKELQSSLHVVGVVKLFVKLLCGGGVEVLKKKVKMVR